MGVHDAITKFNHKTDLRESRDEMLIGDLVRAMARQGHESDQFAATAEFQRVRFRVADDVLSYVHLVVDRKTKNAFTVAGQVNNYVANPTELIAASKVQPQSTGEVEIIREANSFIGRTTEIVDPDDYLMKGPAAVGSLVALLGDRIERIKEALRPYKKATT